ncbi:hypothetical protein [Mycobacterium uberis]|uniref:hypothetical protein n=1 Tax=Mycobacterium uberis TaxID=2162698 RepID=UPI001058AE61|nr:hypothetical protein [Mycobacterium uberis]
MASSATSTIAFFGNAYSWGGVGGGGIRYILPTVDLKVMAVALRGIGGDPLIQYTDSVKMFAYLNEVHGANVVSGIVDAGIGLDSDVSARPGTLPKYL